MSVVHASSFFGDGHVVGQGRTGLRAVYVRSISSSFWPDSSLSRAACPCALMHNSVKSLLSFNKLFIAYQRYAAMQCLACPSKLVNIGVVHRSRSEGFLGGGFWSVPSLCSH